MALDIPGLKKRQEEARANRGNFYKPVEGKNTVRVFTFKHKVTKADAKAGLFGKNMIGKMTDDLLERVITRQFNIGGNRAPTVSTDATIKQWQDLKKSKGEEAARSIAPRKAFILNIVDTGSKDLKMRTFAAPASVFNAIVDFITDEEYGEEMLGRKGRDFVITYKPNASPSEMYTVAPRKEGKSPKLSSELEGQVKDLYSEEEAKSFGAVAKVEEEDDDADDEGDEEDADGEESDADDEDGETVDTDEDDDSDDEDDDDDAKDDSDGSDSDDDDEEDADDDSDEDDDEEDGDSDSEDEDEDDDQPKKKKLKKKKK